MQAIIIDGKFRYLIPTLDEEIEAVAAEIEEGTYDRRASMTPTEKKESGPADFIFSDMRELDLVIGNISKDFDFVRENLDADRMTEIKASLRINIDTLEDLYRKVRFF